MTTPNSHDSRSALARLVLADRARGLSGAAGNLALARHGGAGGRAGEVATLGAYAERLLTSAVVHERERGSSWAEIGRYLGVGAEEAERRFGAAAAEWSEDASGRVERDLDLWADVRLGVGDKRVDGGDPQVEGRIDRSWLATFLDLLAYYVRHFPADGAWEDLARRLDEPGEWHAYTMDGIFESLDLRLIREQDLFCVRVTNAHTADLRLRVSTLLEAFGAR
ncbi:hypothetical protein [Actinoplanes sp. NPDC023714]|uniref:hypothetical protein n=1 Tax=Actinoplanes sp. NPDC023714 TaxID=3154322 RepID=UPI0034065A90